MPASIAQTNFPLCGTILPHVRHGVKLFLIGCLHKYLNYLRLKGLEQPLFTSKVPSYKNDQKSPNT